MYRPEKYKKDNEEFIFQFIKKHPFATLISRSENLVATHIPVLLQGDAVSFQLYAHIANHNEQLQSLKDGTEVLVIFHGPNSYISSSWYENKDISTWDYQAVHINGRIKLQTKQELEKSLESLVKYFEKDQEEPLYYSEIPQKMLEDHLPLITGFWIEPFKIQGIAKLHQKYKTEDINRVVKELKKSDDQIAQKLAEEMENENSEKLKE
ncbi:FMN-binding negative transcriptional regulator [Gramella sp. AN32]|uniref:FMN-binding negative transcriptional regulator n=1 Tax=Christiangramia antarctica TaxID=2058158 RepID=A0ABW5X929_9FLAO|nr:FMN-binding negative transcriptional regulator [Gramella sp. AN32]MCM4155526.1 FMN-binding negative transcriptional regulator [Gramella sp. AN32]